VSPHLAAGLLEAVRHQPRLMLFKVACAGSLALVITCLAWDVIANAGSPARRLLSHYVTRVDRELRAMFLPTTAQKLLVVQLVVMLAIGLAALFANLPYWWGLLAMTAVAVEAYLRVKRNARTKALERQIEPFILAMANALKTTPSIGAALAAVHPRLRAPLHEEIGLVLKGLRVGNTIDQALLGMSSRVRIPEFDAALAATLVGRQVGGNLPDILTTSAATLRETSRLLNVLKSKTASGRIQLIVLAAAPALVVFGFGAASPGYFDPLSNTVVGVFLSMAAGVLWVVAIVLGHKVLSTEAE
jgi:tight adherence protein B